jgi:hypothetical protein
MRFEDLLASAADDEQPDLVVNVHVPKTGGHTLNGFFGQNQFYQIDLDMNENTFFHTVREARWLQGYAGPRPRPAYLMTGHIRLDHPFLHHLWMRHVIVTVLRDPVERMISHYNYARRVTGSPWREDILYKGMSFIEYVRNMYRAIGPQYGFFDDTGRGTFARTGAASPERCLHNLFTRVGVYGLTGRLDEFFVLAGYLLGRINVLGVFTHNVTARRNDPLGEPLKTSLDDQERKEIGALLEQDIWFYAEACKEYERRIADTRLQAVLAQTLPLVRSSRAQVETLRSAFKQDFPERPFSRPKRN